MHNDPRTMIASPLTTTRDPFALPTVEVAKTKTEPKAEEQRQSVAAVAARLTLTSTIIGPQRRVAQINGKTYAVGQAIDAGKENGSARATFQLIEVHPRRAVLQCGEERFELTIPEPGKSDKIEILGAIGSI